MLVWKPACAECPFLHTLQITWLDGTVLLLLSKITAWPLRLAAAAQSLEPFYEKFDPEFTNIRKIVREVLQKEDDLNEIVQLVGKVRALPHG